MRYTLIISIFILMLASCKKDKYKTIPTLTYKSVNTTLLKPGNVITFTLKFTDLEGDLTDSIYVEKFEPKCVASRSKEMVKLPGFPTSKNQEGELLITYGYRVPNLQSIKEPQCANKNDTAVFRFVLKDKAQNKSDTVVSETIIIAR